MSHVLPFVPAERPKIAIVGEAPGEQEVLQNKPFVGASGQELTRMLRDAQINRYDCYITNVFWSRPPDNKIENFCGKKAEVGGAAYPYPPLRSGKYFTLEALSDVTEEDEGFITELHQRFGTPGVYTLPLIRALQLDQESVFEAKVLDRLKWELILTRPVVVIALGNTACWALLGQTGISKLRGSIVESSLIPGLKVLPTYHPAAILRVWKQRIIAVVDLIKAKRESEFPEIRRRTREIWINPDLHDLEVFWIKYLLPGKTNLIAFDIETIEGQLACIGFAGDSDHALIVPFIAPGYAENRYWSDTKTEVAAWRFVQKVLGSDVPKLAQNGLYDLQYLHRAGIQVRNMKHDTMILHHALEPELPKSLGFLGSIYTNAASWKGLRPKKITVTKGED